MREHSELEENLEQKEQEATRRKKNPSKQKSQSHRNKMLSLGYYATCLKPISPVSSIFSFMMVNETYAKVIPSPKYMDV
jgi:hypothetical protein